MIDITEQSPYYKDLINMYKDYGERLTFNDVRINDMSDEQIKYEISIILTKRFNIPAWSFIFNDVLHKRRTKKLNKIINNIKV